MAESITQSEIDHNDKSIQSIEQITESTSSSKETSANGNTPVSQVQIIWTPRFIITFTLTLICGLSAASLLTQVWLNGFYRGDWLFLLYTALLFGYWIVVTVRTHSLWIRFGGIFGIIWAIFTGISFVTNLLAVSPASPIIAHLNAATNSALLGSYICLSIDHTPFHRWDRWFFRIAPLLGGCIILLAYFFLPPDLQVFNVLESITAAVALNLCILVWWLRPSNWKVQPGPTLLFGLAPFFLLILAATRPLDHETNFFFSQVVFLCILLGILRILQGERRISSPTPN